jgi:UPF0755 protein
LPDLGVAGGRSSAFRQSLSAALALLVLATLTAALGGLALVHEWRVSLARPLAVPAGGLHLLVPPGRSLRAVALELQARGALANPQLVVLATHLTGQATGIRAGEYRVQPGTTLGGLLQDLQRGRVVQHALTVIEGWSFAQLLAAVGRHEAVTQTLGGQPREAIMAGIGAPGVHPEGRFLPETYFFPRGTTDVEVLQRAYRHMAAFLAEAWAERAPDLVLESPDQALVLASIVEKESAVPAERARVAGVFLRRLARGMPLQADPTVIYGLGDRFDGDLRRQDLLTDTPYNTYVRRGLPPTPIALPGRAAIRATVRPEPGSALYFVARGDGTHQFSDSLQEHQQAVARYQRRAVNGPRAGAGAEAPGP